MCMSLDKSQGGYKRKERREGENSVVTLSILSKYSEAPHPGGTVIEMVVIL